MEREKGKGEQEKGEPDGGLCGHDVSQYKRKDSKVQMYHGFGRKINCQYTNI